MPSDEPTRFTGSESAKPELTSKVSHPEIDTPSFRDFILANALTVLWERAWLCTCRNPMTLAPQSDCPICHGKGIAYLPATEEHVIIQSQERSVSNVDVGLYDSGTAIGTTNLESKITFRDRITVPDVEIYQSLIFDVTNRRIENGMFLTYDVKKLDLVMGTGGRELKEGLDYTFDEPSNIFYPKEHLNGTNVSINMTVTLRYMVADLLKESRYQYTKKNNRKPVFESMPRKLLLKREDIFVNSEPFSLNINTAERLEEEDREIEVSQPERSEKANESLSGGQMVDPKRKGSAGFFGGRL